MVNPHSTCPLCTDIGGRLVFQGERLRVIQALDMPGFAAFYRVVWNAHQPEMSDLSETEQAHCLRAVSAVERVLRDVLLPTKINLAALGNVVPHLHWHVIARFDWDTHFPAPVWANAQRELSVEQMAVVAARRDVVDARLRAALHALA